MAAKGYRKLSIVHNNLHLGSLRLWEIEWDPGKRIGEIPLAFKAPVAQYEIISQPLKKMSLAILS